MFCHANAMTGAYLNDKKRNDRVSRDYREEQVQRGHEPTLRRIGLRILELALRHLKQGREWSVVAGRYPTEHARLHAETRTARLLSQR
jgi:hypothetical protein